MHIWHPVEKQANRSYLTYGDLRKRNVPGNLSAVYQKLAAELDSSFVRYNLSEALFTYEPLDYGGFTYRDVLKEVKNYRTRSFRSEVKGEASFPVILYHHGSQGLSDENFVMAECFASRGYIFISANFHLPYSDQIFGLMEGIRNDHSSVKAVTRFARSVTQNDTVIFIGHTWGAQVGWCYLFEPGWANAFISLETTIEFKSDTLEIKDKWPFVYNAVKSKRESYPIPILMFANTQENDSFLFFENTSDENINVSAKDPFEHDSNNSAYLMRYFFRHQFNQPDTSILRRQIELYAANLEIIETLLSSVTKNEKFRPDKYRKEFYIN